MRYTALWLMTLSLGLIAAATAVAQGQSPAPIVVSLQHDDQGWKLLRAGQPYLIKGGGGDGSTRLLASLGGNSIRTWGVGPSLQEQLDEAHRLGLSVCVGIWLGQVRQGFNYDDPAQVARQRDEVKRAILRYKDHPAVLIWGLGNEMEDPQGTNLSVWKTINELSRMAKQLDPNHPTMTVIAELGGQKVPNLHRYCPDIDLVGINSYGGAPSVPERYRQAGGVKPYVLTEFGPPGRWEVKANEWGAPPELSSTQKATTYKNAYEKAVLGAPDLCVGSYAFIWGFKQEATATWFGILLPDGSRLAAADVMSELWTGQPLANHSPVLSELKLTGKDQVEPGATIELKLTASDPEGDPLAVEWVLQREAAAYGEGGDREATPPVYQDATQKSATDSATIKIPTGRGGYRVFAYVRDNQGGAAVANVPVFVKGDMKPTAAPKAALPLVVYDDMPRSGRAPYTPSGWMGNQAALKLDEACNVQPRAGKTCLRIDYQAPDQWAGIVWQDPPNDWGDQPGGHDLTGAKRLRFWARGAKGGESINVELGLYGSDKNYPDSDRARLEQVTLTQDWQAFTIDLQGKNLSRIKSGFAVILTGAGQPLTIYLDDIAYE